MIIRAIVEQLLELVEEHLELLGVIVRVQIRFVFEVLHGVGDGGVFMINVQLITPDFVARLFQRLEMMLEHKNHSI